MGLGVNSIRQAGRFDINVHKPATDSIEPPAKLKRRRTLEDVSSLRAEPAKMA